MVACIDECCRTSALFHNLYEVAHKLVGISDGVVVGINQHVLVLVFCVHRRVGLKVGIFLLIALPVVEVRAVGVQHHKCLLALCGCKLLLKYRQQCCIEHIGIGRHIFLYKLRVISFLPEIVDK